LLVFLLLWGPSGCSFLLAQGPPAKDENSRRPIFDSECTRSNFFPAVDTALAASAAATLLGTLLLSSIGTPAANKTAAERQASENKARVIESGALVLGAIPTASAIWGYRTTRKCREYEEGPWRLNRRAPAMTTDEQVDAGE